MTHEGEPPGIRLTGIHLDLTERSIRFEAGERVVARLRLAPSGVIFFEPSPDADPGPGPRAVLPTNASQLQRPSAEPAGAKEVNPTVIRSGRLKSVPREGKLDRSGRPTAFATFVAHEADDEQGHAYLATFHGHTREIALMLGRDTPLTVEGYPHVATDPRRKDTFSVINVLQYPGKPPKKPQP